MKNKIQYLIPCIVLCAVLYGQTALRQVSAQSLSSVTSESIQQKENQISQIRQEKETMKNGLSNLKEIKKNLEQQKDNLKEYVNQLDSSLEQIEQNILALIGRIDGKEKEIQQAQEDLEAALEKEQNQKESTVACIRLMYETGRPNLIDLLMGAKGFGDFLNYADYVEKVYTYGMQMCQDYEKAREYAELCKEELELEKEILDETKANVEEERKNLEELIEQKTRDIIAYETDINNKANAIREYEEEIKAQEEEIKLLEAAVAEEKKKLLASSVLKYDGGLFTFPLATYTRISDEYGMRIHPTLGVEQFHNGVDFASPKGTDIYAAYDGKVVAAAYSATMGNYVMIDHGDGLYTLYMHASALYVKKDDTVAAGETIAAVGSTGRSTGNHLHFSVRLNGSYVSPWEYLKQ